MINIVSERCPANHRCPAVMICPVDALEQAGFGVPKVDEDKCLDCGRCTYVCPTGAIRIEGK